MKQVLLRVAIRDRQEMEDVRDSSEALTFQSKRRNIESTNLIFVYPIGRMRKLQNAAGNVINSELKK